MKENSIEKTLENIQNVDLITLLRKFKKEGIKNFIVIRRNDFDEILSDYKRVLKENEELKNEIMEKELEVVGKEEYTKASMGEIIEQYYTANEDCITKQRIEDIIDRIDYDIKKTKEIISNGQKNNYQITRLKAMNTKSLDIKKRLQELLESEK